MGQQLLYGISWKHHVAVQPQYVRAASIQCHLCQLISLIDYESPQAEMWDHI
jgi:hypothetical protein